MLKEGAEIKTLAESHTLDIPVLAVGAGGGPFTANTMMMEPRLHAQLRARATCRLRNLWRTLNPGHHRKLRPHIVDVYGLPTTASAESPGLPFCHIARMKSSSVTRECERARSVRSRPSVIAFEYE